MPLKVSMGLSDPIWSVHASPVSENTTVAVARVHRETSESADRRRAKQT
jgi:hypothetical protein